MERKFFYIVKYSEGHAIIFFRFARCAMQNPFPSFHLELEQD